MRAERNEQHLAHADRLMLFSWMLIAGLLLFFTYRGYQKVRPGVLVVGMWTYAGALLSTFWVIHTGTSAEMSTRITHVFEVETIGVVLIWYSLYLVATLAAIIGTYNRRQLHRALRQAPPNDK